MYKSKNKHDQLYQDKYQSKRLIRIREVIQLTGISKSYIYQLCNNNQFPQSISLIPGGSSVAWIESEVLNWIDERIQDRNSKTNTLNQN